jgi:hypothetical protein
MFPLQWHPEAEAKVSHNLRLKDEEAAEALAASVQALQQQQVRQRIKLVTISLTNFFNRREWKVNWTRSCRCSRIAPE